MKITLLLLLVSVLSQPAFAGKVTSPGILDDDSDPANVPVGQPPVKSKDRSRFVGIYSNVSYAPMVDLVDAAKSTIDIEIYEMADPEFRAALRRALKRGVTIQLVKDPTPLNDTCPYFENDPAVKPDQKVAPDCSDQRKLLGEIRDAGGRVVPFVKAELCGQQAEGNEGKCFEHGKTILIDRADASGRLALVSTGNFNASNLCTDSANPSTCNRDYTYITRDADVISAIGAIFSKDLEGKRYDLKAMLDDLPGAADKLTVSPYSKAPLLAFIQGAKSSLRIQNQYIYDKDMVAAIKAAAKRGVKIQMMVSSVCAFGPPKGPQKVQNEQLFRDYESAGVQLRMFDSQMKQRGHKGYLHAKVIVRDDDTAWVGSINGSMTAMDRNREYGLFFTHPKRVQFLKDVMDQDFADPNGETWQESMECKKDDHAAEAGE